MKRFSKLFALILILFLFTFPLYAQENQPIHLMILHINDFHGRLLPYIDKSIDEKIPVGGAAYLAKMIQVEKAKNSEGTLLLSAGDMFQGTPVSNIFHGRPVIEVMNYLKFDAMAVGNHEFDWGQDVLKDLLAKAHFPFLSANIVDGQGRYLSGVKPHIMIERKGLKIAIIGITTIETSYTTKPDNVKGLTFLKPEKVLSGLIREVRDHGANLVIVLSHPGFDSDKQFAENVQGIDIIVGGHSHTVVINPAVVRKTIVVQAGYNGIYMGVLELAIQPETKQILEFSREREIKTVFAGLDNKFDEKVTQIVNTYKDQLKESFTKVVGETTVDLVRNYNGESNIGNLICDAMRESTGAEMAFESSGSIRADILKGKITMEQVFSLLPFDSILLTMDLTGRQIFEILEQSATLEKGLLQSSGIKVTHDLTKPSGSRVISTYVRDKPLETDKIYRVAIIDFLAAGGDKFETFKDGKNVVYCSMLRDIFVAYLQKHSPVRPRLEGRSIFIK